MITVLCRVYLTPQHFLDLKRMFHLHVLWERDEVCEFSFSIWLSPVKCNTKQLLIYKNNHFSIRTNNTKQISCLAWTRPVAPFLKRNEMFLSKNITALFYLLKVYSNLEVSIFSKTQGIFFKTQSGITQGIVFRN